MVLENKCGQNKSSIELAYDELFYLLDNAISKKYGVWKENVPISIVNYYKRKSGLLPNGIR